MCDNSKIVIRFNKEREALSKKREFIVYSFETLGLK